MDALSPTNPCQQVTLKWSSQSAKTEILNNFCAYVIDRDPGPMLVVQPNQKPMAEAWSKDRLAPMLRDTPALHGKVYAAKGRDSNNTIYHKKFAGGHLTIGGANSPAGLASRPIRFLACDEIDRYEDTKEGNAFSLAKKRTSQFWNRKILVTASPTVPKHGVDAEYENALQHQWQLECKHCDETQFPELKHFQWDKADDGSPENIRYYCESCGGEHTIKDQWRLKARGMWVVMNNKSPIHKGYWMNQFGSPRAEWIDTIVEFLNAKDDPQKLRVFKNTALAEVWEEVGEAPPEEDVQQMRLAIDPGVVPDGALALTAGVDVQKDRLYYEVRAWVEGMGSHQVDHGELYGDTMLDDVWAQLDNILNTPFDNYAIKLMLVDSGYNTDRVYQWCRGRARVFATKGQQTMSTIVRKSKQDISFNGKQIKGGLDLWHVNTDYFKDFVHSRVSIGPDTTGGWFLNRATTDDYCAQIVAEHKIETRPGKWIWKQIKKDNHYLDTGVYNAAAAHILGVHRYKKPKPKPSTVTKKRNYDDMWN